MKSIKYFSASLLLSLLLTSCGAYNKDSSVAGDGAAYGVSEAGLSEPQKRLLRAQRIVNRNCISCHTSLQNMTELQVTTTTSSKVGDYLAVPGDLDKSALWRVLRGGGETNYMPPTFALDSGDVAKMKDWILQIGKN